MVDLICALTRLVDGIGSFLLKRLNVGKIRCRDKRFNDRSSFFQTQIIILLKINVENVHPVNGAEI